MQIYAAAPQNTVNLIVETAILTTLVALLVNKFLPAAGEFVARPFRRVGMVLWRWVAPRNPFNASLRSYKKHLGRSDLSEMENPVGPAVKVPLREAFAPLKLVSTSSPQGIELFPYAAKHRRFIVLGGPGTGKTTLMKSVVVNILNGSCHPVLNKLVPAFVVLRKLSSKQQNVMEAIISTFDEHNFPGAGNFVNASLSQGKMFVILDGLDEVGQSREFVAAQIQEFCEKDSQREHPNWIVATCRENSYRSEDLRGVMPDVVRVEPFANHHMRVFLEGWPPVGNRVAIGLYSLIQSDPQIRDVCRNPLLLTILTGLYLGSEEFELPSSRERFYNAAVDELLLKRPGRRHIRQTFSDKEKRRVLNEVSLERLETVLPHEDPEELTSDALRSHARKTIPDEAKIDEFIKELLEKNGIIKETGQGTYTTSHRTFQEYFAACQAEIIRVTDEVLERFTERPDLVEVLYFYCGLLRNVPQLTDIAEHLAARGYWELAGRCLLNIQGGLKAPTIEKIVDGLFGHAQLNRLAEPTLEILASLAQRNGPEFDSARRRFDEAIDAITAGSGERQASDLGSALAATPSVAMRVIPALLGHKSESLRMTAITLLRDLGTDEGLDRLVRLLGEEERSDRPFIADIIAGLIKTRREALAQRAVLLPERHDKAVWPLEEYFPARLAIPIAEALSAGNTETGIPAIDCAATVVSGRKSNDRRFLKHWRNASRDARRASRAKAIGRALTVAGLSSGAAILLAVILLIGWADLKGRAALIELLPYQFTTFQGDGLAGVQTAAAAIVSDAGKAYPPSASGASRVLPWNWVTHPVVPHHSQASFALVTRLATPPVDLYHFPWHELSTKGLTLSVGAGKIATLFSAILLLRKQLSFPRGRYYWIVGPAVGSSLGDLGELGVVVSALFVVFTKSGLGLYRRASILFLFTRWTSDNEHSRGVWTSLFAYWFFVAIILGPRFCEYISDYPIPVDGLISVLLWMLPSGAIFGLGFLLLLARWPRNSHITAIDDFLDQSNLIGSSRSLT